MGVLTTSLSVAASAQSIKTVIPFPYATQGVAVDPITNKVYVVAPTLGGPTDNLAVIDGNKDVLLENISVPSGASFVAVNYFTNLIYVAGCNYNETPSPCTVTVINGYKNSVVSTIAITSTPGLGLSGIVADEITGTVYVANANDNVIDIIGCQNKLTGTIGLNENSPSAIAINPILGRLYVPFYGDTAAVVNIYTKKVLSTTTFGNSLVGAAVNLSSGNVYLADQEFGPAQTGVLNANGSVKASVTVDDGPLGVDVDPITNRVFVAASDIDTVDVINASSNTVIAKVTGVPAEYLAVNFFSGKVYVTSRIGVTVLTEK